MKSISSVPSSSESPNGIESLFQSLKSVTFDQKYRGNKKGIVPSLLPLLIAACGGGSSPSTTLVEPQTPPPPPPETTNFTEIATGHFVANDDSNSQLHEADAQMRLIVEGKGGNDVINTGIRGDVIIGGSGDDIISSGDGDDLVRGGAGAEDIDLGAGNDIYVIVGTTSESFFEGRDLTNIAGTVYDISAVIDVASEGNSDTGNQSYGTAIDGGSGVDTLIVVGSASFSQYDISNFQHMIVTDYAMISLDQWNHLSSIKGEGETRLFIFDYTTPLGQTTVIDLRKVYMSGFTQVVLSVAKNQGELAIAFFNPEELNLGYEIFGGLKVGLILEENNEGEEILFSHIVDYVTQAGSFTVEVGATLIIDDLATFDDQYYRKIGGEGTVVIPVSQLSEYALNGMVFSADTNVVDEFGNPIDVIDYWGKSVVNLDELAPVYFNFQYAYSSEAAGGIEVSVTGYYGYGFEGVISVDYIASDGSSGTLTFTEPDDIQHITLTWDDNDIINFDNSIEITLFNQSHGAILNDIGEVQVIDYEDKDILLRGTDSDDMFVFETNWGRAMVISFEDGFDLLDMSQTGLPYSDLTISGEDGGTRIQDSSGNTILLENIDSTLITIDDFWFG